MGLVSRILTDRGSRTVLEKTAIFAEERHKRIVNNLANIDTPGYQAQDLDVKGFQKMLADAIEQRTSSRSRHLKFKGGANIHVGPDNKLEFKTVTTERGSLLRHDKNNVSVETEIVRMAKNTLSYTMVTKLLKERYQNLIDVIKGK